FLLLLPHAATASARTLTRATAHTDRLCFMSPPVADSAPETTRRADAIHVIEPPLQSPAYGPADALRALPLPRRQAQPGRLRPRPGRRRTRSARGRRRALGLGAVRGLRARHSRRGPQSLLPPASLHPGPRAGRLGRPKRAEPAQWAKADAGRASRTPLRLASNATSDSTGRDGTDVGSAG